MYAAMHAMNISLLSGQVCMPGQEVCCAAYVYRPVIRMHCHSISSVAYV